ncbi:MAG: SRPBCC family protein [Mitsuaria chitosanitabida]|uniref:SRPBCC family protein n=1 Tax=Roseateles chitosanitabidus TaxID=65048 RepID=UPI001B1B8880|nr:SRPBCC family protein [Roseateles chitosanitabidus]MBO9685321.1 SRPBCC family protein [Roseateles chitosanitabidus]
MTTETENQTGQDAAGAMDTDGPARTGAERPGKRRNPAYERMMWIAPLLGAVYGLVMRALAGKLPGWVAALGLSDQTAGVMSIGFVLMTPFVLGALTVYLQRREKLGLSAAIFMPWLATGAMMLGTMVTLLEGVICIAILSPVFLVLSSLGGLLMKAALAIADVRGHHMGALALTPLLALLVEGPLAQSDQWQRIDRSIVIAAAPDRVWSEIVSARDIRPDELKPTLAHLIGVPRPVAGINHMTADGEVRESRWERGVHFRGRITERDEGRSIAWRYEFSPDSFPPGTMDDHVVLGGRYLDLGETRFVLTPVDATHTRLDVEAHYRVSSTINVYAVPVADLLGRDFVDMLLALYRDRSEAAKG